MIRRFWSFSSALASVLFLSLVMGINFSTSAATLPCVNTTDINIPADAVSGDPFGCVQRTEPGKNYTLVIFTQVYCGACKDLVAKMPTIWSRLHANTTIRVTVLDRFSNSVINYAAQPSLQNVFVANDKSGRANFGRDFGVRYTPSLILFDSNGNELYRAPRRGEVRGANDNDILRVEELTGNN